MIIIRQLLFPYLSVASCLPAFLPAYPSSFSSLSSCLYCLLVFKSLWASFGQMRCLAWEVWIARSARAGGRAGGGCSRGRNGGEVASACRQRRPDRKRRVCVQRQRHNGDVRANL